MNKLQSKALVLLLVLAPLAASAGGTKIERKARKPASVAKRMAQRSPAARQISRRVAVVSVAAPKNAATETIEIDEGD